MYRVLITLLALIVPVACQRPVEPPRDAQGNILPAVEFEALSEPTNKRANIIIDAIDQFGHHGTNADTGLPYPWDGSKVTPYRHTIYYEPGLIISVRFEVIIGGLLGDIVGCKVYDKGVEIKLGAQISQIPEGMVSGHVTCIYTTGG